jgi:tRNA 2-selenouridine synthase
VSLHPLPARDALQQLAQFSAVIDARTEDEFALDHLPGAINWPSLRNAERIEVGTIYKQVSAFEAKKLGAGLVAANIAQHIAREVRQLPRDWQPLVYCWRGGKRSGSLALVLSEIGFRVTLVEGGYKATRAALLDDIPQRVAPLAFKVICGPTGSGKTRLLNALAKAGAQVLDLEALANHRSSVLGLIPGRPQPSQKRFDTLIWETLGAFDPSRPVYVESESKKVGNVTVPAVLMDAMRASPCLRLDLSTDERVALLLEDYDLFVKDAALFCARLDALTHQRGRAVVEQWKALATAGNFEPVVRELLTLHYDPGYATSTRRNFSQFDSAPVLTPDNRSDAAMLATAHTLLEGSAT